MPHPPIILCVRDPDYDNEFHVFGGPIDIIDIDLGRSDLREDGDLLEWAISHLEIADEVRKTNATAADAYIEIIANKVDHETDRTGMDEAALRAWIKGECDQIDAEYLSVDKDKS